MALPTADQLTGASTTNAQQKTHFAALRNFLADLLGTDSSDTAAARTALGVAIGTDVQAYDANLRPLVAGTAQAATSGTSIDFTGIPSWVNRITMSLDNVSTVAGAAPCLQVGHSGGIQTTGYDGGNAFGGSLAGTFTSSFNLNPNVVAATLSAGIAILTRVSGNTWAFSGCVASAANAPTVGGGMVTLSGALDRVRLTTSSGTDTFDAGSVNILYE